MPLDLPAALRRHLLDRFPADRAYPRAAFHDAGMPPLIAAFLDRTLDRWVEIERDRFQSGWFDIEDPGVQRAERNFFDILRRTARVPADAWEEMLGGAVDLVVRFLTMPARGLTGAIFEGSSDPLPIEDVRARLSLFDAYPYLEEVAAAYLDRKRPATLDPDSLFTLLDRIDRRVVNDYGLDDWLDLLAPLFALARHVPALDGVPADRLQRFFEAKGETDLADLLAEHEGTAFDATRLRAVLASAFPGATAATDEEAPSDIAAAASESTAAPEPEEPSTDDPATNGATPEEPKAVSAPTPPETSEPASAPPRQAATNHEPPPAPPHDAADAAFPAAEESGNAEEPGEIEEPEAMDRGEAKPPAPEGPPEPIADASEDDAIDETVRPLWERFAERTSDGDSVNARFGSEETNDASADMGPIPLWKRFFSREGDAAPVGDAPPLYEPPAPRPAAPAPPSPAPRPDSLETLEQAVLGPTSPAQRRTFIKHLFGGDEGKYATVLHILNGAASWTEASQIIARDVFRPSRINIYGEQAVAFTDAVEARFRE